MSRVLMLAGLVGIIVVGSTVLAAAAPRHHAHRIVRGAVRYVPGQIYNYNTIALTRWLHCWCPTRRHFRAVYTGR